MRDIKAVLNKRMENCENCDVDDQPDPEAQCETCRKDALAAGRSVGMAPETGQVLDARALIKAGYRFAPADLQYWQWRALAAVDAEIDRWQAEKVKSKTR